MNVALTAEPPRELSEGVFWLGACQEFELGGQLRHVHNSTYLIVGSASTLMFDTGYPGHWPAIENDLDCLLGTRAVDYVVPSHTETPHSGNLGRLLTKYPNARVLGDVRDYWLYFPNSAGRLQSCAPGETVDLGADHRFMFIDPVMRDLPNTIWGYESGSRTMFTADAFIYAHHPATLIGDDVVHASGDCRLLSTELPHLPDTEYAGFVTSSALYFTRYHDMAAVFEQVRELLRRYPADFIAPTHGCVIRGGSDPVVEIIERAVIAGTRDQRG